MLEIMIMWKKCDTNKGDEYLSTNMWTNIGYLLCCDAPILDGVFWSLAGDLRSWGWENRPPLQSYSSFTEQLTQEHYYRCQRRHSAIKNFLGLTPWRRISGVTKATIFPSLTGWYITVIIFYYTLFHKSIEGELLENMIFFYLKLL